MGAIRIRIVNVLVVGIAAREAILPARPAPPLLPQRAQDRALCLPPTPSLVALPPSLPCRPLSTTPSYVVPSLHLLGADEPLVLPSLPFPAVSGVKFPRADGEARPPVFVPEPSAAPVAAPSVSTSTPVKPRSGSTARDTPAVSTPGSGRCRRVAGGGCIALYSCWSAPRSGMHRDRFSNAILA